MGNTTEGTQEFVLLQVYFTIWLFLEILMVQFMTRDSNPYFIF